MKKRKAKASAQKVENIQVKVVVALEKIAEWLGEIHHELYELRMEYEPEGEDEKDGN